MCQSPTTLADGQQVACRLCWQCRERKIDDWVGRCIAERQTAQACHMVTLTYGRDADGEADHLRAALLTYSDVQKFFKKLRKDGYPVRYLVVGEYGSLKKRAHWHAVLYWQHKIPPYVLDKRFDFKYWDHGYAYFQSAADDRLRYMCKYITKDTAEKHQHHLSCSKKPPLGDAYFRKLAEKYVAQGIGPRDLSYHFDIRSLGDPTKIRRKKFMMSGATAVNFLAHFCKKWGEKYPGKDLPTMLTHDFNEEMCAPIDFMPPANFNFRQAKQWHDWAFQLYQAYKGGHDRGEA